MAGRIKAVHLVENSDKMREVQAAKLEKRVEGGIQLDWYGHIDEVPHRGESPRVDWCRLYTVLDADYAAEDQFTMIIAHEFFDAMPINLFEVIIA